MHIQLANIYSVPFDLSIWQAGEGVKKNKKMSNCSGVPHLGVYAYIVHLGSSIQVRFAGKW